MTRQGAVPGITVHDSGMIVIDTPKSMDFFRLCLLLSAVKLEAAGIKSRGGSKTALAKREFNIKGDRAKVIAFLEAEVARRKTIDNAN